MSLRCALVKQVFAGLSLVLAVIAAVPASAGDYRVHVQAWPPGSGTVTCSPAQEGYAADSEVTLTATPAPGWTFSRWAGKGVNTEGGASQTVTVSDHVLAVAYFSPPAGYQLPSRWAWGRNTSGELGNGGTASSSVAIRAASDTVMVASHGPCSAALDSQGNVWQWGNGVIVPTAVSGISSAIRVAAGEKFYLALLSDGSVQAWGQNSYGQLGNGTLASSDSPVAVAGLTDVVDIAAGKFHALALKADGTVWAWGRNTCYQLGDGSTSTRNSPVQVARLSAVRQIGAGWQSSFAIMADGTVRGWGDNSRKQLGDGTSTNRSIPTAMLNVQNATQIAGGETHTLILIADGRLFACGNNDYAQLATGQTSTGSYPVAQVVGLDQVKRIACGHAHSVALKSDGTVWGWGANYEGQLAISGSYTVPSPTRVQPLVGVTEIAAGSASTHAVSDSCLLSVELSPAAAGRLIVTPDLPLYPRGTTVTIALTDVAINFSTLVWKGFGDISYTAENNSVTFQITQDMALRARLLFAEHTVWTQSFPAHGGSVNIVQNKNVFSHGEACTLQAVPQPGYVFAGWRGINAPSGSETTATFSVNDGVLAVADFVRNDSQVPPMSLWTWGSNGCGVLGTSYPLDAKRPLRALDNVAAVATGEYWVVALKEDGTVWNWGARGPITYYPFPTQFEPEPVQAEGMSNVVEVGTSGIYCWARSSDGRCWIWERTQDPAVQVPQVAVPNVVAVSCGLYHFLALRNDGTVWGWGSNSFGELGLGAASYTNTPPTNMALLKNVVKIAAGDRRSYALTTDGQLWGCGLNTDGTLGDGTTTNRPSPVLIEGLENVRDVTTLGKVTYATTADGSFWEWGSGTYVIQMRPLKSTVLSNVRKIINHCQTTIALTADGGIWTWGYNSTLLGDGTTNRALPSRLNNLPAMTDVALTQAVLTVSSDGALWGWGLGGVGEETVGTHQTPASLGMNGVVRVCRTYNSSAVLASTQYALNITHSPEAGGTVELTPELRYYPHGQQVTLTPHARPGYRLIGWEGFEAGEATIVDGVATFSIRRDMNLTLNYVKESYLLAVRPFPPEGGTVSRTPEKTTYDPGETVTLQAEAAEGWIFDGWFGSFGSDASSTLNLEMSEDVTAVAMFKRGTSGMPERTLWGWGYNDKGELGTGYLGHRIEAAQAVEINRVVSISGGNRFTAVLCEDGSIWACGINSGQMFGEAAGEAIKRPTKLQFPSHIIALAAVSGHVLGVRGDGTVWAATGSCTAVQVEGLQHVAAVAAGHTGNMALTADGAVYVWGDLPLHWPRTVPLQLFQLPRAAKAISCGRDFMLALLDDGTVRSWGRNSDGRLGDGTDLDSADPVVVRGLNGVLAISAGYSHSLALRSDHTVWAWGASWPAKIGDGSTSTRYQPVQVLSDPKLVAVSAGYGHSAALRSDDRVWVWGENGEYQLGFDDQQVRLVPVQKPAPTGTTAVLAGERTTHFLAEKMYVVTLSSSPEFGSKPTVSPKQKLYRLNDQVTLDAGTTADHDFLYWTGLEGLAVGGSGETAAFPITRDVDAVAVSQKNRYLLKTIICPTAAGSVTVSPLKPSYEPGELVTVAAEANHGWQFVCLDIDQGAGFVRHTVAGMTLTMNQDIRLVARFRYDPAGLLGGTLYGWGWNAQGHIGDGTLTNRLTPVPVSGMTKVVQVNFAEALKSDGTVWTWGSGSYGQLGDGTTADRSVPGPAPALTDVVQLDGNYALKADGTVWSWGYNGYNRLGRPCVGSYDANPAPIPGLDNIIAVASGNNFGVALRADGTVWTWGYNGYGELGDGTRISRMQPAQVLGLPEIVTISAGSIACVIDADGRVWAWGTNDEWEDLLPPEYDRYRPEQLVFFEDVPLKYFQQGSTSFAIDKQDRLWSWGSNMFGEVGDGTRTTREIPALIANMTNIILAMESSIALTGEGYVYTWGSGSYGTLGIGDETMRPTPTKVPALSAVTSVYSAGVVCWAITVPGCALSVSAVPPDRGQAISPHDKYLPGVAVTITAQALDEQWRLKSWSGLDGVDYTEETIDGVTTLRFNIYRNMTVRANFEQRYCRVVTRAWPPQGGQVVVTPSEPVVEVGSTVHLEAQAAEGWSFVGWRGFGFETSGEATKDFTASGNAFAVAIFRRNEATPGGRPFSWGDGAFGQLGNGLTGDRATPVGVLNLSRVVSIATGSDFSLALDEDGAVWAWGRNTYSQLGDGSTTNRLLPVRIDGLSEIIELAAGEAHALALKADGTVYAWGRNNNGQLGDGTMTNRTAAVASGFQKAVALSAGQYFSLALAVDGTVWGWGANDSGQLGDGTQFNRTAPSRTGQLIDIIAIDAGNNHALAVRQDGTAWAWGSGADGQLGDGATAIRLTPVQMSGISQAARVSGGGNHSLILLQDGTVRACGANSRGALGDATTTGRNTPVAVSLLTGITAIAAGSQHSLALKSDGTVWSWGAGNQGQLGLAAMLDRTAPVQVPRLLEGQAIAAGNQHSLLLGQMMVTLTLLDKAGGDVAGDPAGDYRYGTTVELQGVPAECYRFAGWRVNGLPASNLAALSLLMDGNKLVEPSFIFQMKLTVENGSGSGTYDEKALVPIAAAVPPKHRFTGWTGDVATVTNPAAANTTVRMNGNYTVTANFERIIYPLPVEVTTDADFVYQNTEKTTRDRHRVVLHIALDEEADENGNSDYEIKVEKTEGAGDLAVVATEDPRVWHLVGSRRNVGATGAAVVKVTISGDVAGEFTRDVTVAVRLLGDIKPNGFLNMIDKAALSTHLNGIDTGLPKKAFDLDGNGFAEPTDMALLNSLLNGFDLP